MRILIAPNAFKNSLDAVAAAEAIQAGLLQSQLACTCECFAIGDGGDGTASLIVQKCQGKYLPAAVHDPLGRPVKTRFGLIDQGKTAVIEMADASGIRLLTKEELAPLSASSFGTGEMMRQALETGVDKMIVCLGGSATVDGGSGMLKALGARFLDGDQQEINMLPEGLSKLASIDLTGLDKRLYGCEIVVLCDVENTLLGPQGAAAVFGPQKGANEAGVAQLDTLLKKFAEIALLATGKNMAAVHHGGAAGGAAAGLYAFANAKLVNGAGYFLKLTDFATSLAKAHVVITGEGSLDLQTLQGKGPYAVAHSAKQHGKPVIGLAGRVETSEPERMHQFFDVLLTIGNAELGLEKALSHTMENLTRTAHQLGNFIALCAKHGNNPFVSNTHP